LCDSLTRLRRPSALLILLQRCLPPELLVSISAQPIRELSVFPLVCIPAFLHHPAYSCVGVWQNDRVEIIANDQGNRTTPSCVSFSESGLLIGDAAKNQVAMNLHNTYVLRHSITICLTSFHIIYVTRVLNAKRLIGRKFDDPEVQADIKHFPFKVFNKTGKPYIRVQSRGEEKEFVS
jgi:hypothetical protein